MLKRYALGAPLLLAAFIVAPEAQAQNLYGATNGCNIVTAAIPAPIEVDPLNGNACVEAGHEFQVSPTITVTAGAYSAGYSEGGVITAPVARMNGGSGILLGGGIKSTGGDTNQVYVYAWSKSPASTCTDHTAFVASGSDSPYAMPNFPISLTLGASPGAWDTATYAQFGIQPTSFVNQDGTASKNIYLCIVTAGSVTPAATTDLSVVVSGVQD